MKKFLFAIATMGLLALATLAPTPAAAAACNTTLFSSTTGDVAFPMCPPPIGGATAGQMDNMGIGANTPRPGSFTTLKSADGLTCASIMPAAATDAVFFIATRPYVLVSASAIFSVTAGGASKLQLVKDAGTNAPGAGTDLLTNNTNTGFDLALTANTVQAGTLVAAGTRTLAAGDRLSVDFANAIQSSAGIVVTACMAPQ